VFRATGNPDGAERNPGYKPERVGRAKARLRRARRMADGGHASLCPPYRSG
jgi:hypothetical protein